MSTRDLVVLGTASQVPTRYRNHGGYLLRWDGRGLLFDPGEGCQRQMLLANVSATDITRILITHFHGDHCLGLAGIVQRISLDQVPHRIDVHFPQSGQIFYDRLRHASLYQDKANLFPRPIVREGKIFEDGKIAIFARRLDHGVDTFGYRLCEHDSVRVLPEKLEELGIQGRQIGELVRHGSLDFHGRRVTLDEVSVPKKGQVVAFVMDTRLCDGAYQLAEGADLLVCESTFLNSEKSEAYTYRHLTVGDAARLARESNARRLVLTHFSQRYPNLERFKTEAEEIHDDVVIPRDGMYIPVPKRRYSHNRFG
ncbi:MAG: ribonuclease Z [Proteobacteria bacterium]|jgi:ribonuclease Z|nr:ribonuclease Z [Pseudomonadota bacterium]